MKVEALHIGQKINHPQYGVGVVKSISEHAAEVRFDDALRTVDPERSGMAPAEASASIAGLEMPLEQLLRATIETVLEDRKSTRLNSSHRCISYAVFCLKKKIKLPNKP